MRGRLVHKALVLIELGAIVLTLGLLGKLAGRIGLSPDSALPARRAGVRRGRPAAAGRQPGVHLHRRRDRRHPAAVAARPGVLRAELMTNLRQQAPAGVVNLVLNSAPGVAVGTDHGLAGGRGRGDGRDHLRRPRPASPPSCCRDLGRLGNRETPVVLSLLVIEDLSMAVYLPIAHRPAGRGQLLGRRVSVGIALVAVTAALVIALRYGRVLGKFIFSDNSEVLLLIVFGLALLVGGLALQAQVSEAVGAFLVGIALSGRVAESAEEVLHPAAGPVRRGVLRVLRAAHPTPGTSPPCCCRRWRWPWSPRSPRSSRPGGRPSGPASPGRVRSAPGTVMVSRGEFNIVIAGLATSAALDAPGLGRAGRGLRADHGRRRPADRRVPATRSASAGRTPRGPPAGQEARAAAAAAGRPHRNPPGPKGRSGMSPTRARAWFQTSRSPERKDVPPPRWKIFPL